MTKPQHEPPRIVLLGAGRLASHLLYALIRQPEAGQVVQIYSRSQASLDSLLAEAGLDLAQTTDLGQLYADADIYLFALTDTALTEVWTALEGQTSGLWVHTSGATSLEACLQHHPRAAVLYPLQTFSRERAAQGSYFPFYIEASDAEALSHVRQLAELLGQEVHEASSQQRLILHLGAVLACNFSNYLILEAEELLQRHGLPTKALLPLLDELLHKLHQLPARSALTGPAARGDLATLARHEALLADEPQLQQLYHSLSQRILELSTH